MKVIIDRFEGEFAVIELENKKLINVPKELIPVKATEGSVLKIEVDDEETKKSKDEISYLMNNLWKD